MYCEICGFDMGYIGFSDGSCERCGQSYMYEEGVVIVLTTEQREALAALVRPKVTGGAYVPDGLVCSKCKGDFNCVVQVDNDFMCEECTKTVLWQEE